MNEIDRLTRAAMVAVYGSDFHDGYKESMEQAVRAILTAMREPVDVEAAGAKARWPFSVKATARAAITAHIDAILGETK